MTAIDLLIALDAADFRLRVEAGALKVSPWSLLSAEQKALLSEHKAALVELLRHNPPQEHDHDDVVGWDDERLIDAKRCQRMWESLRTLESKPIEKVNKVKTKDNNRSVIKE